MLADESRLAEAADLLQRSKPWKADISLRPLEPTAFDQGFLKCSSEFGRQNVMLSEQFFLQKHR